MPKNIKVGINGFGRMGRLLARVLISKREELGLDLVMINEKVGTAAMAAYLLEYDSTHGRFSYTCTSPDETRIVLTPSGITSDLLLTIAYSKSSKLEDIKWKDEVEVVFDCTGAFLTSESLQGHFRSKGVRKVIVSAPVDSPEVLNVVVGCNDNLITPDMKILTAASCTTNCAAPIVGVLDKALGIEYGTLSTVHNVTPTQSILDVMNPGKKNDFRRARAGSVNLAPTTTGSAKAITMIYPHLKGKLNGLAIRVPLLNSSITDLVIVTKKDTSVEEVNKILIEGSKQNPTVLGYSALPLVSTDYLNDPRSSIVDGLSTQVVSKRLVKVLAWYDNEWGYVNRMADLAVIVKSKL